MKTFISLRLDEDLVARIDKLASKYTDGNRSTMIHNLLATALMDVDFMETIGLLDLAKAVRGIQEKIDAGMFQYRGRVLKK